MASQEPRTLEDGRAAVGDRDKPPSPVARPVPAGMKRCPKCGEVKALDAFALNRSTKDGHQTYCKPCGAEQTRRYRETHPKTAEQIAHARAYMATWRHKDIEGTRAADRARYARDRDAILGRKRDRYASDAHQRAREIEATNRAAILRRKRFNQELRRMREKLGCTACGLTHGSRLLFHHLDPATKSFSVANGVGSKTRDTVLDELLKCIVLCTPCHVRVHHGKLALSGSEIASARSNLAELVTLARNPADH